MSEFGLMGSQLYRTTVLQVAISTGDFLLVFACKH